jgi:superfamily I DNA/RNA helicase
VAETIGSLVYSGVAHQDIAVLYRANTQAQLLEETLALEHIPFRVVGGQSFFDKKEVRDALAFLAVAYNPRDEVALRRIVNVPPRGIGPTSLERLVAHGESTGKGLWHSLTSASQIPDLPATARIGAQEFVDVLAPLGAQLRTAASGQLAPLAAHLFHGLRLREAIHEADDSPGVLSRRLENLDHVKHALERFERGAQGQEGPLLGEFLRNTALTRDSAEDDDEAKRGRVTLMTLHSAKGLEFPYVFLVGLEEELLPHKRTIETGADLGEERRLCYVGMTRARRRLWLTHAQFRQKYGKLEPRTPSRFLQELPEGPGVKRWNRDAPPSEERADEAADDFFKKMRAQLGIET